MTGLLRRIGPDRVEVMVDWTGWTMGQFLTIMNNLAETYRGVWSFHLDADGEGDGPRVYGDRVKVETCSEPCDACRNCGRASRCTWDRQRGCGIITEAGA